MDRLTKLLLLLLLLQAPMASGADAPVVVRGLIDLTEWDFTGDGPVNLTGGYEFYWQEYLSSSDLLRREPDSARIVQVPGEWNGTIINNEQIDGQGYATYRLNVLTSRRDPLALKLPDLGTAYRLIVDGTQRFEAGKPGIDSDSTIPSYKPAIIQFTPRGSRVELIFQVANYDHRMGGIWLPVLIGTPDQLASLRENQLARDLILFGAILIIGLYNLALFALRPENKSSIFLGFFCILLATRQIMVGDRFMTTLFPNMPFVWYLRIEYLGWYLAPSMFMGFLKDIFPREVNRYAAVVTHAMFGLGALVVLLTPPYVFTYTVPAYQLLTVVALLYGTFCLGLSAYRRREGSLILLFAYGVLFYTVVSDILVNAGLNDNVLLLDVGLFVFILSQSILISYRFTQSFKTIEAQRAQLEATNLKLRTQEKLRREAEEESDALHQRIVQSEKMEAIGLLAGGVAHDLNNILSTTVTYPELALLDLPKDSPLAQPLQMTRQAGLRAAAVIQDLLTLARRGVVQREVVDLNDVIAEYLGSIEHQLLVSQNQGTRVETNLADDLYPIEGSPVHLGKLIMNLVSNGIEAQPAGGTIYITTHNERIHSRDLFYMTVKSGDYVILSIEDEGTGIDPDDLDRLFEPFYTTKVMGQSGTGLGMSVVWGVVYDHGGAIDVLSEQGTGTRFDVYLPRTSRTMPARPKQQPISSLMGAGEKVLVVDDIADQRQLTTDVLTRLNYVVETCASGEAAVEILEDRDFDVLILDMIIDMGWDGLTTYQEVIKIRPGIKTMLVSGFAETDQVIEAQKLGAGPFLKKPFTIETIGTKLKELLRS